MEQTRKEAKLTIEELPETNALLPVDIVACAAFLNGCAAYVAYKMSR